MTDLSGSTDDDLCQAAEAYEDTLRAGDQADTDFEIQHPDLARSLRKLNTVFLAADDTDELSEAPAEQIGRFRPVRKLGSGSFGTVWLAHDPVMRRDVAIKIAHVGTHAAADLRRRFQREAHLAARLHHPNIVPVFETGEDGSQLYIVSEYCAGLNLSEWIRAYGGPVDPEQSAQIVLQLADAANHAHRQGLIHRDIKPDNVLLDEDGANAGNLPFTPRLTDFGLARDLADDGSATRSGIVMGTAEYMSPEQATARRGQTGPVSDVYSLGVLLYRLLVGRVPFSGRSEFEVIQQIVQTDPAVPSREVDGLPRDLNSICLKCLEKEPEKRYASAAALRDDLDRFLHDEPTTARPVRPVEQLVRWVRRAPTAAALVLLMICTCIGVVAALSYHIKQIEQHTGELQVALRNVSRQREVARSAEDDADAARAIAESERKSAREISYRSDMTLAFQLWEQGLIHPVREILERQLPADDRDLRGAEWFVLSAEVNARSQELGRHDGAATECVLSGDHQTVWSAGTDGVIRQWDLQSGTESRQLMPDLGELHALAIAPDGETLAVGGVTGSPDDLAHVVLIDTVSGEQRATLQLHETTIECLAFSPDHRWLAGGSRYQPVQLTRLRDGQTFSLAADRRNRGLGFSADSNWLAFVGSTNHVSRWQVDQNEPEKEHHIPGYDRASPYLVQFAPPGTTLLTSYTNRDLFTLTELPENRPSRLAKAGGMHSPSATYQCCTVSADGRWMAAGDESGRILMWDLPAAAPGTDLVFEPVFAVDVHEARVTAVQITDGPVVVSSGEDGRICQTSPLTIGAQHVRWDGLRVNAAEVADGRLLLGCDDGSIRQCPLGQFDADIIVPESSGNNGLRHSESPGVFMNLESSVRALDVSTTGGLVAVGTTSGGVFVYDRRTQQLVRQIVPDNLDADTSDVAVYAVAFSSDDSLLAYTGRNGSVTLCEVATGEERWSYAVGNGLSLTFCQDDTMLACGTGQERMLMLTTSGGQLARSIDAQDSNALSLNARGDRLAVSHGDGRLQVVDLTNSGGDRILSRRDKDCQALTFAPGDRTLISLTDWGGLRFASGDAATTYGGLILPLRNYGECFYVKLLVCDNRLLAITSHIDKPTSGNGFSSLYIWPLHSTGKL